MNRSLILNPPFIVRRSFSLKWGIILRVFWALAVLSIIALLVFYIFQVNFEVSERYLIKEYERRLAEVSQESKNLEISLVQMNSLNNVAGLLKELNFVKIDKIHYIRVLGREVVTK